MPVTFRMAISLARRCTSSAVYPTRPIRAITTMDIPAIITDMPKRRTPAVSCSTNPIGRDVDVAYRIDPRYDFLSLMQIISCKTAETHEQIVAYITARKDDGSTRVGTLLFETAATHIPDYAADGVVVATAGVIMLGDVECAAYQIAVVLSGEFLKHIGKTLFHDHLAPGAVGKHVEAWHLARTQCPSL